MIGNIYTHPTVHQLLVKCNTRCQTRRILDKEHRGVMDYVLEDL